MHALWFKTDILDNAPNIIDLWWSECHCMLYDWLFKSLFCASFTCILLKTWPQVKVHLLSVYGFMNWLFISFKLLFLQHNKWVKRQQLWLDMALMHANYQHIWVHDMIVFNNNIALTQCVHPRLLTLIHSDVTLHFIVSPETSARASTSLRLKFRWSHERDTEIATRLCVCSQKHNKK